MLSSWLMRYNTGLLCPTVIRKREKRNNRSIHCSTVAHTVIAGSSIARYAMLSGVKFVHCVGRYAMLSGVKFVHCVVLFATSEDNRIFTY